MTIRVIQDEGRWWLQDVEGHPFVSIGINHLQSDCWLAPYNRHVMLERYGPDLADEQDNFNAEGKALPQLVDATLTRLELMGFNSLGLHTYDVPSGLYADRMFYCRAIEVFPLGSRFKFDEQRFPDIFSQDFETQLDDRIASMAAEHGDHDRFIGYAFSDIPRWYFYGNNGRGNHRVHPWVKDLFAQPEESAGYQAAFSALGHRNPATEEDSDTVMEAMIRWWYDLHVRLIRKHDPGRLILGDKLHSPHLIPDWFLEILKEYVDVVLIQWYTPVETQQETLTYIHRTTGKPILNGDSCFGCAKPPKQTKVKGFPVDSQAEVGAHYAAYLDGIMDLPFMLGWHHCGMMEQWDGGKRHDWEINENGFMNPFEELYDEIAGPMKAANERAQARHALSERVG